MRPLCIVEVEVTRQRRPCFTNTVVGPQIDLFIFHRPPKALDKNVVPPGTAAIHAHRNRVLQQQPREGHTCELRPLIGIENLRPPIAGERLLHRLEAEVDVYCDRQPPRQDPPAEPINHSRQIDEPARHRNIRDIHAPHLVRSLDRQPAQQIRVDFVPRPRLRRVGLAVDRLDPHPPHQRGNQFPANHHPLATQQVAQHPAARQRVVQMQLIDPTHDRKLRRRNRPRLVVEGAPAQPQQLGLPPQRKAMVTVDHRFALSKPAWLSAPAKKSLSSVSSPILACSTFKSTTGAASAAPPPNNSAAPSSIRALHAVIWLGCTSYCCARSASVFSPLMAATATFALKAGWCVRRARLAIVTPDMRHSRRSQADFPLIGLSEFAQPPLPAWARRLSAWPYPS